MRGLFVWMTGHDPRVVATTADPAEQHELAAMGVPVLFAALVAAASWAVAGSALLPASAQPWGAALVALLGMGLVLGMDRVFLYVVDAYQVRRFPSIAFGIVRFGLTILMSSVTAQALMPVLLKDELALHALKMVERDDLERHSALAQRYGLDDKARQEEAAAAALTLAQNQAKQPLPPELQRQLAAANQCVVAHRKRVAEAPASDGSDARAQLQQRLQDEGQRCQGLLREARAARSAHEAKAQARLAAADQALNEARSSAAEARQQRDERAEAALKAQASATTPNSATVLADLLRNDAGAFLKWLGITALLLVLEAMPLILKSLRGRSAVGARLVLTREARLAAERATLEKSLMEADTEARLAAAARVGLDDALDSAELQQHFRSQALSTLRAAGPLDAVVRLSRKMQEGEQEVRRHMAAYPSHHAVATGWTQAVRQAAEIITGGAYPPAAKAGSSVGLSRVA